MTARCIYVDVCIYVHTSVQTTSAYIQRRSQHIKNGVRILVAPFDPPSSMLTWHETKGGMNNGHMDHPAGIIIKNTEMATLKRGGRGGDSGSPRLVWLKANHSIFIVHRRYVPGTDLNLSRVGSGLAVQRVLVSRCKR